MKEKIRFKICGVNVGIFKSLWKESCGCNVLRCIVLSLFFLFYSFFAKANASFDRCILYRCKFHEPLFRFFFILVRLFRLLVLSFILSLHAEHEVFCQSAKDTCVHFLYKLIEPLVTIPNRGEAHIVVVVVVAVFFSWFLILDSFLSLSIFGFWGLIVAIQPIVIHNICAMQFFCMCASKMGDMCAMHALADVVVVVKKNL